MLDAYKEITPVVYGENAIKHLYFDIKQESCCFRMHWHDRMEILRIVSGSLDFHEDGAHWKVLPDQVVIIGPKAKHCGFAGENGVVFHTLMFDVDKFYNTTLATEKYLVPVQENTASFQTIIANQQVVDAVDKLIDILKAEKKQNPLLAIGAVYETIGLLYEYCRDNTEAVQIADNKFKPILEYINANFTEQISAKDICTRFGYNETYFCRRFKANTGITVMQYIQILRMEKAQKLLKESSENVGDIAWQCGFLDISYFSTCFKKQFGVTPSDFRKKEE